MATKRFFPSLADIITLEDLPKQLEFLREPLTNFLSKLYYKDLQYSKSVLGDTAFYSLKLVSPTRFEVDVFNSGFFLVLNPDSDFSDISSIPIRLEYNWPILAYVNSIPKANYEEEGLGLAQLFELGQKSLKITDEAVVANAINQFSVPADSNTSRRAQFVNDINAANSGSTVPIPSNTDSVSDIIASIESAKNISATDAVYNTYIFGSGFSSDTGKNIKVFFSPFIEVDIETHLLQLLTPKIKFAVALSGAIEFPRNLLLPVNENNEVIPEIANGAPRAQFRFIESEVFFNSRTDFGLDLQFAVTTPTAVLVPGVQLILKFTNLKLDLSDNKILPEALADGREEFKGLYAEELVVGVPWIRDSEGNILQFSATNLLIGKPDGISGTIAFAGPSLVGKLPGGITAELVKLAVSFNKGQVDETNSELVVRISIPGLKSEGGSEQSDDFVFTLSGKYLNNGFYAEVIFNTPLKLIVPGLLDIQVHTVSILKQDNNPTQFSFSADFYFSNKPGFVGDLLPEGIKVNPIVFERGSGVQSFVIDLDWEKTEDTRLVYANDILDARIPLNKTILNFITLNGIRAIVENHPNGRDKQFQLLVDAGLKIGPVSGEASNFGLKADLNFRQSAIADETEVPPLVSNLQFVPPNGIGIGIDAKAVKGGGFLLLDYDNNRYTGALNLQVLEKFEVNAFGILVTQLPSGQQGFSLIALLSARFTPPVQLGLGFTLNGLGGLLGLHRTANTDLLRNEIDSGRIGDLMFPVNPQARFAQIISNLEASFPVKENQFIFGPGARIGWGTPTLITADIILLFEVPDPVRVIVMGVAKSLLPDKNKAILKLQIAFLAVIDFANKSLKVDAAIYDSRLLNFRLDGTMAMRVLAGNNPYFLVTVGGFHPSFSVPSFLDLPQQRRLAISMVSGSALSIGAETYYAVSSNSVQFGAALWLRGQIAIIKAEGGFAFDALVMFNPFRFCVAVAAYITIKARLRLKIKIKIKLFKFKVEIKLEDVTLAGVDLRGQLCGPSYWNANATAKFSLLGVGKSFDINREWGQKEEVTIPRIDLRALLLEALENDQNWKIEGGTATDDIVAIRDISDDALVLKGNGTLEVTQTALPLKITIQKFGNGVPLNDNRFQVTRVIFGNQNRSLNASLRDTRDFFAPGEFRNLDNRRLSARSFEKFPNGVVADPPSAAGAIDYGQHKTERTLNYEHKIIDAPSPTSPNVIRKTQQNVTLSTAVEETTFTVMSKGNAANRYERSKKVNRFTKTSKRIAVNEERFHIVDCRNLQDHSTLGTSVYNTEIEAQDAMKELTRTQPVLKDEITVVPSFEVAA